MDEKTRLMKVLYVLAILGCVYLGAKTITEIKGYRYIGGGVAAGSTMSFEGKGEVMAKPDIATVSFTIREKAGDLKTAQANVTAKEKSAIDYLTGKGIDKEDIKTENYNSYPTYSNNVVCAETMIYPPSGGSSMPCRPTEQKISGYEVSEYVTVKIREESKTGEIVTGIGNLGIKELNGPNYTIENEDNLKEEARKMAIEDAKKKAEKLSRDLGVRLVRIVSFSESGNYPMPYYAKDAMAVESSAGRAAPSPELPTGENKIMSNVTITYEIR